MAFRHLLGSLGAAAALGLGTFALSPGFTADPPERRKADPKPTAAADPNSLTSLLGGEERASTHVSTDKPIYKPGEKVYIRGVVLDAFSRKPITTNPREASIQILGPKGDIVVTGSTQIQDSVIGYAWEIPQGQAGGEYTAKISHPYTGFAPAIRKFDVRAYRAPRLKNQIVFVRDGYGPGDLVSATLKTERAEGGFPAGAKVTVQARVDGDPVHEATTTVDATGLASARFELPKEIARGEGTLAFIVEDGGVLETASKTIPILLQTIDLTLYPEGGDLVAGLPNRIYVQAKTPAQKPADLAGVIRNGDGQEVATLKTEHEGRGRTTFTPRAGEKYALHITEPAGIKTTYPLPEVKREGAVISATEKLFGAGKPLTVQVASTESETLTLVVSQREKEISRKEIELKAGTPKSLELDASTADGVLRVTLWRMGGKQKETEAIPLAERLVFRQPKEALQISIIPDKPSYTPGSPVKVKVQTTTPDGKPVAAVVGLTVTDDSVLEMIEKREQTPRLPVMAFFEGDVKDLADAHVYLDAKNEKAPLAIDLLLATQGWRRFAYQDFEKFLTEQGDDARRVVALRMPVAMPMAGGRGGFGGGGPRAFALPMRVGAAPPAPGAPVPAALPLDAKNAALPKSEAAAPKAKPGAGEAKVKEDARGLDRNRVEQPVQQDAVKKPERVIAQNEKQANLAKALEENGKREAAPAFAKRRANFADEQIAWVVVREFAHTVRPDRKPGDRVDFAETLYWHAGVKTNEQTGEAEVSFHMNDSVTGFRITADAFNAIGAIGSESRVVESVEPFYVEPKLPLEVTSGDIIQLPLSLVNRTSDSLSETTLLADAKGLKAGSFEPFAMTADSRVRRLLSLPVGNFSGNTDVTLSATAGPYADKVTRPLVVKPLGFPVEFGMGGMLAANTTATHEISIPDHIVPGSLTATVAVYPTPLANMTAALERLIQEPYGCFEQTSSSTYPLVMAQQYFTTHTGVDPALITRSNDMLEKGYKRLTGYECKGGGYEWFGEDPGHEALTAYGLLEFTDMATVRPVDTAMIERTRSWLLKQRDGQGGFKRGRRALHTWIEDRDCSNAYITLALLRAGVKDLASEVATVKVAGEKSSNTYVIALAANVLHHAGDKVGRNALLDKLVQLQEPDGAMKGATTSIIGSGGDALVIETTALATLAWLTDQDYIDFADKGVKYLAESCKGGRYGSTQSTVLAIQAIVEQDKALARPKASGTVQLLVDEKPVGEPVKFDTNTQGAITLPDMTAALTTGKHAVAVKMIDGSTMPYSVTVKLHSTKPDSSDESAVRIETSLKEAKITEGSVTEVQVKVSNIKDEAIPTPIALIGIPGGLEVRHDQLKELVKSKKIAAYEVIGRDVVLYWREMAAKQTIELPVSLVASIPGSYTGPASRAYQYYTDEHKQWANPLKVDIAPRTGKND